MGRCSKVPHRNAGAAKRALKSLLASGKPVGVLQVYICKTCHAWHVGNATGGQDARGYRLRSRIDRALAEDARKAQAAQGTARITQEG
jgi:hypothetical protein